MIFFNNTSTDDSDSDEENSETLQYIIAVIIHSKKIGLQMETRPKRNIAKPLRYQTTSSDESPKRRITSQQASIEDIDEDIDDLRRTTQTNMEINQTNSFTRSLTQNPTSRTHTYIPNQTNESYTNNEHNQSQDMYQVYNETHNQAHISDIRSHTKIDAHDINNKTYTNLQPPKNTQIHNTDIQSQIKAHDINSQTHIHNQPHSDANVQLYNTNNNVTHTNFQPNKTYSRTSHNTYARSNVLQTNTLHTYPTHNYISQTETDERYEGSQDSTHDRHSMTHIDVIDNRKTHNCERVEAELKRMNTLLQKILKCVQIRRYPVQKPDIFPISTIREMERFERIDEEDYTNVINYFRYIGGFNLKEAINLCFKEAIKDEITPSFTWWGREEEQRPLYNARLTIAIYEAVCFNEHFEKPTRSEFQMQFREVLRTAKERLRHRVRDPRARNNRGRRNIDRDLWRDERPEETNEQPEEMDELDDEN